MKYFFLHVDGGSSNHAGSKAARDCDKILSDLPIKKIKAYSCFSRSRIIRRIVKGIQLINLYRLPKKSVIMIQYPLPMEHRYLADLRKLKEKRKLKYVFIIHDLESIRNMYDKIELYEKNDNEMFEIADMVIAHNEKMIKVINEKFHFPIDKMVSLGIFDYLFEEKAHVRSNKKGKNLRVMIVGNLEPKKAGYLYNKKFNKIINFFSLYGPQFEKEKVQNAKYYGQFPPEKLVEKLEGSFGLVWDGNSPDSCEGKTGKYLLINNPHKTSMYLASGFPVIIWKKAALADFVKQHNVGILIDSLWEIPEKVNQITDDEYETMLKNVAKISNKLTSGYYLKTAIRKVIMKMK